MSSRPLTANCMKQAKPGFCPCWGLAIIPALLSISCHTAKEHAMTRQTVYLIRHGQVNGNILHLDDLITTADFNALVANVPYEPINAAGVAQVEAIVPQVKAAQLARLYCSPLLRARQTADILAAVTKLPVQVCDDLYELIPAPLHDPATRQLTLRQAYVRSGRRLANPRTRDCETFYGAYRRIRRAWITLTEHTPDNFGIIGHQGIFRLLFGWLMLTPRWRILKMDTTNAGISIVRRRIG